MSARALSRRQRGQALLLVLVFLAAFLLLIWAALGLAASSFLGTASVRADTRSTYALDAGVAYGIEWINLTGTACIAINPPPLTLNYPTGNITVTVTVTPAQGCNNAASFNLTATASGTSRLARALIDQNQNGQGNGGNPLEVVWEAYQ
jgi:hypothetical protein